MSTSQENASFTVKVKNGLPTYRYEWYVEYDGNATLVKENFSTTTANTFTHTFTDYDFDDYSVIKVGCIVGDAKGDGLQSDFAIVYPKN